MQKHTYRTILIWAVIAVAIFQIYPTVGWMFLDEETREERLAQWQEEDAVYQERGAIGNAWHNLTRWAQFDRDRVINLGLDLQGGIHMVLGLEMDEMDEQRRQEFLDQGFEAEEIEHQMQQAALQRIRMRIDEFEAREPVIQAMGANQIQVQLPGERDIERAQRLITRTAFLTFHRVSGANETRNVLRAIESAFPDQFEPYIVRRGLDGGFHTVREEHITQVRNVLEQAREEGGVIPDDKMVALSPSPNPWDEPLYQLYVLDREPLLTGEGLRLAMARPDPQSLERSWEVLFQNDGEAARRFEQVTRQHIGEPMAIVLDGQVVSAPTIQSAIGASGTITGNFTQEQAQDLAIALNSGTMPVPIREEFTGVVGASLGSDSVQRGVQSAFAGLALVMIFMIFYYRHTGLLANVALLLNALFVLACFAYFNFTLTLPGIAGLVLTVGMAVDANVLIYERIREELRNGKSLLSAVEGGYARAQITILDANVTTLIAAMVLLQFGTGPIEGFAIALSIGVVCSVFTALVVTRAIFDFLLRMGWLGNTLSMMSFFKPESRLDFLGRRKIAAVASAAAIIVGFSVFIYRGQDNFGVDFTSGSSMIVHLDSEESIEVGAVREALFALGFADPLVQEYGDQRAGEDNRFLIRLSEREQTAVLEGDVDVPEEAAPDESEAAAAEAAEDETAAAEAVPDHLEDEGFVRDTITSVVRGGLGPLAGGGDAVIFEQVEMVGAAIGEQLRRDAIWAVIYSLFFIIVYLWFRFQITFALGAVAALVHDVLLTLGLFALFGRQLNLPVVAALLTIIGYSLNDTIVIYDRIREDIRLYRGKGMSLLEIMNLSVNQTLGRTLVTSTTTLFVLVVLFIFGGPVINDFAFALIAGVIVGTYSSIFVASPIVHYLTVWQGRHVTVVGEDKEQEGSPRRRRRRKARGKDKKEIGGEELAK